MKHWADKPILRHLFWFLVIPHNLGEWVWEYGTAGKHQRLARRHRINGNVQMVLWKAGEQGHTEDFWYDFDKSWWPTFRAIEGAQSAEGGSGD